MWSANKFKLILDTYVIWVMVAGYLCNLRSVSGDSKLNFCSCNHFYIATFLSFLLGKLKNVAFLNSKQCSSLCKCFRGVAFYFS